MDAIHTRQLRATLEPLAVSLVWVVARVPFDVKAAWPKLIRLRVQVELAGKLYRTALFSHPVGGHCVIINKKMQQAAHVTLGSVIDLSIAPDLEPRPDALPSELTKLLSSEKALAKWFATNSESMRREIGKWVADPSTAAARKRRADQMAERLLLTMEAETYDGGRNHAPAHPRTRLPRPTRCPQGLGCYDLNPAPQPSPGTLLLSHP